jgi:hypothetical protein
MTIFVDFLNHQSQFSEEPKDLLVNSVLLFIPLAVYLVNIEYCFASSFSVQKGEGQKLLPCFNVDKKAQ